MRIFAVVVVSVLSGAAPAEGVRAKRTGVDATIERGLGFLAKDAVTWKADHNCASCHHAALVVWALREAKQRGHAVDEPVLADLTKWMAESGDGKTSVPRPAGIPQAVNTKAVYFALALGVNPEPDEASRNGLKLLIGTVMSDQTEAGSWAAWPESRPPMLGRSDESVTALAALSLLPVAATGDASAAAGRDNAVRWLAARQAEDDPQSTALRLLLWRRLNRPVEESAPLVERVKARQKADGGWGQTNDMPADAWATGQALYALAHAGLSPADPVVARGRAFLGRTQRDDGSWPMTSRPTKPGGGGSKSLVPITGAGSAWAVLGLVRSGPPVAPK